MRYFWIAIILLGIVVAVFSTGEYGLILIFILLGITALTSLISIISQCLKLRRLQFRNNNIWLLKLVAKFALLFLCTGTFLYILVFRTIGVESLGDVFFSNTELFFRSLFCSLDLFFLNIDSNIIDRIDNHPDLKTWIFIQAILSALTTVVLFLSLLISRIREVLRLRFNTKVSKERSHLYIFFGLNKATELLVEDIKKNDNKALVILIDKANIDSESSIGFDNIFSFLSHRSSSFSFAKRLNAVVAVAGSSASELNITGNSADIFSLLDLPKIKRLIRRLDNPGLSDSQLRIFFLSGNEENNVKDLLAVAKDITLQNLTNIKPNFYCHARKSGPYAYIDDFGLSSRFEIKIVDSSFISIENLKQKEEFHPVNLVKMSPTNPGTVSSPLNCLIVGFGEVGRDALRFLYEFGAFPDEKSTPNDSYRSPFKCIVLDSSMDELKGGFLQSAPSLESPDSGISFLSLNANDAEFSTSVMTPEFARDLNYVVVATGNDKENSQLALKIFQKCWDSGNSMQNLRILIRCISETDSEIIMKMAEFYNSAYDPGKGSNVMRLFGRLEDIFTYDLIIRERIEKEAQTFFTSYQKQSKGTLTWEQRQKDLLTPPISLLNLRALRRKEGQDVENALHAATKINILERSLGKNYNWKDFLSRYFKENGEADQSGKGSDITYPRLNQKENLLILNLAMLEHLRWMASHELLGYLPCEDGITKCDERRHVHPCLTPWQSLDQLSKDSEENGWTPDYKIYDYYVIDTTISLNRWRWEDKFYWDN